MGSQAARIVLLLQLVGLVLADATATLPQNPTKRLLQNASLPRLTSDYLRGLYQDVTLLKISNSRMGVIDSAAFDHLTHLNLLEISSSVIQQELDPDTFSRLPGLEILILRKLGLRRVRLHLKNVQELILAENELGTVDGRSVIGPNVNFLDLSRNNLTSLEGSFAGMSKLSLVDISRNRIRQVPPVFQENTKLVNLLASENEIQSTDGLKLPWLKTLDLFDNKIEVLDSKSLAKMAALEELVLAFNRIGSVEDAFKDLIELRNLNLAWNHIERLDSGLFRNNLYLTKLSLQGNKISSLEKFQNVLPHLTYIDLSHNILTRIEDGFFLSTPGLTTLDLRFNHLKTLDTALAPLTQLRVLNLAYNELQMSGDELSANEQLLRVNLSSNALRGGLTQFKNNQLLTDLDVSNNEISEFCDDGNVTLKNLAKLNLSGNRIRSLSCLNGLKTMCEVDMRNNPLTCGEELDELISNLITRKGAPYRIAAGFGRDVVHDQCETLSLSRSLNLWKMVRSELCPNGKVIDLGKDLNSSESSEVTKEPVAESIEIKERPVVPPEATLHRKTHIVRPLGWLKKDETVQPVTEEHPQSGRNSWGNIEDNSELSGFEDEERRPQFSWYTVALILIGVSLTLTCFNLVVFFYIKLKVWKRNDANSSQKYTALHNEVYKNTTEPSGPCPGGEPEWTLENEKRNKIFTYEKINEILLNFGLNRKDKDSDSMKNILIHSGTGNSQSF